VVGAVLWSTDVYRGTIPGIKNHGTYHRHLQRRGLFALVLWVAVMAFYSSMYWYPRALEGAIRLADPLSLLLRNSAADQYFLYSYLYTLAVLVMGWRMVLRYRHSRYQQYRTLSVAFVQLVLAFLLPSLLRFFHQPEFYFSYFWPLDAKALYPDKVQYLLSHPGGLGAFMFFWSTAALVVATPLLTWRFGKRWYCSWVCGCGGLAETAGDPFRHLSSKKLAAWRFERWSIHLVLVVITLGTALLWANEITSGGLLGSASFQFKRVYGFVVASILAGVVGTSFYFVMGNRVWCRFFCPMAAILGIFQRYFSRFRITTNGAQCMSCGNCSTYCEMGINVRSYAQRGANIVRASCVGCGICSAVCPRGVLNLECGATYADRFPGADQPFRDFLRSLKR
jgi:Pyruvate/2-oxoacid:ferredoxin oxidoreductase delta subunit